MRQLFIGLIVGAALGAVSATLVAQRSADSYPDAPAADPSGERAEVDHQHIVKEPAA